MLCMPSKLIETNDANLWNNSVSNNYQFGTPMIYHTEGIQDCILIHCQSVYLFRFVVLEALVLLRIVLCWSALGETSKSDCTFG